MGISISLIYPNLLKISYILLYIYLFFISPSFGGYIQLFCWDSQHFSGISIFFLEYVQLFFLCIYQFWVTSRFFGCNQYFFSIPIFLDKFNILLVEIYFFDVHNIFWHISNFRWIHSTFFRNCQQFLGVSNLFVGYLQQFLFFLVYLIFFGCIEAFLDTCDIYWIYQFFFIYTLWLRTINTKEICFSRRKFLKSYFDNKIFPDKSDQKSR